MATAVSLTTTRLLLLLVLVLVSFQAILSATNPEDVTVLQSLMNQWENTPPSWEKSDDPCGFPSWDGVTCNDTRVTALKLSSMGLKGNLGGDIGGLTELTSLDLSYNKNLTGPLSTQLGQLIKLTRLTLAGCGFSGSIPQELGNLSELQFLALNSNKFTGEIPASLGNLTQLYWLDLSDNQLTGSLPVSNGSSSGLDNLLKIGHFHLNKNQLSGSIPAQMFRPEMIKLIHILLNGNQLSGAIPSTIGLVRPLEVLRLDRNNLTGEVPSNLSYLTSISEINLGNNQLSGPLPDLTGMNSLQSLDLSNNTFDESEIPDWLSSFNSLMTLSIENGPLNGELPQKLFSLPQLQQVNLKSNKLYGNLDMGYSISQQLLLVDLQHNNITSVASNSSYKNTLILIDNPVCSNGGQLSTTIHCILQDQAKPYSTSLGSCGSKTCPEINQMPSPQSCDCVYPYEGTLYFNPYFRDLTNHTLFQMLEKDMCQKLHLAPGSVLLQKLHFNTLDELQMDLALFPSNELYFTRSEVQGIGFNLSNHFYLPPLDLPFGPYLFFGDPYNFQDKIPAVLEDKHGKSALSLSLILGISISVSLLVLVLAGAGMYVIWQKKRVERSIGLSNTFGAATIGSGSSGTLNLKGARRFTYDELKKSTNNFSSTNEIGSGGYGIVYRGILLDGQLVAIKRAFQGSMQGVREFKTEIELLSRVHHKNLVGLIGFCFEQAEQILVYELLPNGSLKDSLVGKSGIQLNWRKRLQIALGSARGLAYLHELANPPIIHRDVKSTNILLDDNLNAKVADFGVSKLLEDACNNHISTQVKGTFGYLDPEYYLHQQLTEKSDVYSFGVVMLELLTAKQPIEKGKYVVREVRTALEKGNRDFCSSLRELLDPAIGSFTASLPEFGMYVELALRCTEDSVSDRPSMGEVVKAIETILENEGIATNSTVSASSTITDFGIKCQESVVTSPQIEDLERHY